MPNLHELENAMPVAPLKIIALPSAEKMVALFIKSQRESDRG